MLCIGAQNEWWVSSILYGGREFLPLDSLLVLSNYLIPWSIFYSLLLKCVWTRSDVYQSLPVYYLPIARMQGLVHPLILFGTLNLLFFWAIYMSSIIGQRKHRQHSARAGLAHLLTYPKDRSRTRTHVAVSISKARNYRKSIRFPLLLRLRGCKTSCCWCQYVTITQIPLFIHTVA
jgi:hypothetical protein